jgi:phosphatidate cytidylyltransferase
MLTRILTSLVLVPLAVFLTFYPGGLPFAVAIGIVAVLGGVEFYSGVRKTGARPIVWAGLAAIVTFVVGARISTIGSDSIWLPAVITLLVMLCFLVELFRRNRAPLINVGSTVLGAVYVGWLLSHLVLLRGVNGKNVVVGSYSEEPGAWLLMLTFLGTWACDTGAYFIGKFYGRTKLAPRLSPGKTVEGSVAGLVSAVLLAVIFGLVIKLPPQHALALGLIFGVMTQVGDLSESAVKRELQIKDFGSLIPGHGGILDRFDSLLFTGPVVYYYAAFLLKEWLG